MFPFLLFTIFVVGAEPRSAIDSADPGHVEAEIRRLVKLLGDESYPQREAATRGLAALGEKALAGLRSAMNSPDPEIKARATRLRAKIEAEASRRKLEPIKRQIDIIKMSALSYLEKGQCLKVFIKAGMTETEVAHLFGKGRCFPGAGNTLLEQAEYVYSDCGLRIVLHKRPDELVYRVDRVISFDPVEGY